MTAAQFYLNGQFLPGPPAVPVWDAGFVFGATVTDLVRTFRHQPFRLDDHIARFRQSCRLCRVPLQVSDAELTDVAERLIAHNARLLPPHPPGPPLPQGERGEQTLSPPSPLVGEGGRGGEGELALVMVATPGPIGYYAGQPGGPGDGPPTLLLHTFPLPLARYRRLFTEGAALVVPRTRHVPADSIDPRAKMRSRLFWWVAEQEAREIEPGASALLLDATDHITETAAANFLTVRGGTVVSPPRDSVLDGISLRVLEELCGRLGVPFEERPLTLHDCQAADEALLAGTAFCVAGVRRLHGVELPWPGPVWRRLIGAWSEMVGLDIVKQILQ
jgi:branched-subunit amino acid aminotransferase/4-amino-4-deoxychorismate lyase